MAASSFLDSEATFVQQAKDAGLTQPWIEALRINQLVTFAKLSFAVTSPGVMATDEQVTRFLNTMRDGTAAAIAELAAFKRLPFESQTLMMHNFKSVAKGDDAAPKRVAPPECEARLERQRQQLRGLDITGAYRAPAPGFSKGHTGAGKPLDPFLERMDSDMTVTYFMLPIPVSHATSASSGDKADKEKKRPDAPAGNKGRPGANKFHKGSSKGAQKGSKGKRRDPVPQSLKGMHSQNSSRRYNLLWVQFGLLQAGCIVSQEACLCGSGLLQKPPSN